MILLAICNAQPVSNYTTELFSPVFLLTPRSCKTDITYTHNFNKTNIFKYTHKVQTKFVVNFIQHHFWSLFRHLSQYMCTYRQILKKNTVDVCPPGHTSVTLMMEEYQSQPMIYQVRGFKPGRSRRIFQGGKILSAPSFGGEVKPSVPCRTFTACKRSLNVPWKSCI